MFDLSLTGFGSHSDVVQQVSEAGINPVARKDPEIAKSTGISRVEMTQTGAVEYDFELLLSAP